MSQLGARLRQKSVLLLDRSFSGKAMNYKQIFAIILPIFVDNAFLIIMSMLNTAMISSSGVAAVSAVSMVDSLNMFLVNVFIAVATGGTVIVAQYKGSGNAAMVSKSASQALTSVAIVSIVISVLVITLHTPTLNLLFGSAEADVFDMAKLYLIGSCLTFPFFGMYQAVIGVLRGVAETKVCLFLSVFLNLTNVLLNIVFIVFLDMGIKGLIISLITARVLGMIASFIYLVKYSPMIHFHLKDLLKLDFSIMKKIMYIGVPFAAEQLFLMAESC